MCVLPLNRGFLVAVKGGSGGNDFCQIFYLTKENSDLLIVMDVVCFLSPTAAANLKQKIKEFSESESLLLPHPQGNQARSFVEKYYLVLNKDHTLTHNLYHGSYTRGFVNVANQNSVLFFDNVVGKFDQESKAEAHDMCVEPLNDGFLVVVKGISGGNDFCQILYLTKGKSDLLIFRDIVCFLSENPGSNVSHTAVNRRVTEPLLSEAASAILKQKIRDFSASLQHPEAATSADLQPKIKGGNYLPRRNRLPTKRFEIEGYEATKSYAPSKQETSKPAKHSQSIISKATKSYAPSKQETSKPAKPSQSIILKAKSCELSRQEALKLSKLSQPICKATYHNTSSSSAPKVCIISHEDMLIHKSPTNVYEIPERLSGIMNRLQDDGLLSRCDLLLSERADPQLVLAAHEPGYLDFIPNAPLKKSEKKANKGYFGDVYFSEGTKDAAFLAAGSVIQGCKLVLEGRYSSAFAVVRPPGHHALPSYADGFCILNNVAIGARFLLSKGLKKILIVDMDIHHGNGSQSIFYDDDQVMVISIHSSKLGYPEDTEQPINRTTKCIGDGAGTGYNVNANLAKGFGDADMFYVMDNIVPPLASAFNPDFTLISAGYDALAGDRLGDAELTPSCLATFVHMLKQVNTGRVVLSLEGGYKIEATAKGVSYTVRALLEDPEVLVEEKDFYKKDILPSTVRIVQEVEVYQRIRWDVFKRLY